MPSVASTARALPALLRVGFAEAVAYRAEFLVWVLSTTMPLIMLALWSAVAREAPVGRFGQKEFVAYFLATFIVRQLTSSWVSWQMNYEIRQGTLAMKLLRPVPPVLAFAAENVAAQPIRLIIALPVAAIGLWLVGGALLPRDVLSWLLWIAAMLGGWLITFLASFAIGSLAFFVESSVKVMQVWLTFFFVLSGYMIPIELFPRPVAILAAALPFRYQIGFPVELMTGAHGTAESVGLLAAQWGWVAALAGVAVLVWKRGLRRFAAYGG